MKPRFAPATFLIVFCCTYIGAFALDRPLFRYYPLHGNLSWGHPMLPHAGPAMAWYGLLADAVIIATLCALCIPDRLAAARLRNYLWLFPVGAMLACVYLLRIFFR